MNITITSSELTELELYEQYCEWNNHNKNNAKILIQFLKLFDIK